MPAGPNVTWAFAEQFDDSVLLKIDGNTVLNDGSWNNPTSASVNLSAGAHSFEVRFGQGGGGVGPNSGWNIGFGVNFSGVVSTNPADYIALVDPGDGSLLQFSDDGGIDYAIANAAVLNVTTEIFVKQFGADMQGNISGAGGLTKTGNGRLTISGTNSYLGATNITAGILEVGNGGATGSLGAGSVTNSGILKFNRSGTLNVPNAISGSGSLQQNGTGTTVLSGVNPYTGSTTINAGTLGGTSDAAFGAIANPIAINGNSTLQGAATFTTNRTLNVTGNGKIDATTGSVFTLGATSVINGVGQTITKTGNGTLNISGTQNYLNLVTSAGTTNVNTPLGTTPTALTAVTTVTANAATNFTVSQNLKSLTIGPGALVTLTPHISPIKHIDISPNTLTIDPTGKLNITDNVLVVRGANAPANAANLAAITAEIATGSNGGAWNGAGINSSTAAGDINFLTAVGVIDNSVIGLTTFGGVTGLTGFEILVKYTYYGDANLDGQVTGADYSLIDNGFANSLTGWFNGDFNYDGVVTGADYSLIDNGFANQGAQLRPDGGAFGSELLALTDPIVVNSAGQAPAGQAVVPEPGSIALLAAGALGLLGRRRRNEKK